MKDAEKIAAFILGHASSFSRFHLRVDSGPVVSASLMSLDKAIVYARVTVFQDLAAFQRTGFEQHVEVQYPAQQGCVTELRHDWLPAATAACDLAETIERFIRKDLQ
jgi:hypothetical protein